MDEIKVHVVDYGAARNLMLRYRDPITGKQIAKSAKTRNRSKALKAAGDLENELRSGRYQKPSRLTWEAFRDQYSNDVLPGLAERTQESYISTLNAFESKCNPSRIAELTTARVTAFVTMLRADGAEEATIAKHLRQLKAAARWANRQGLLLTVPTFTMPKRAKGSKVMRGRPITLEEFERMIEAVPKVVENAAAESWRFYLHGLWDSGLRLSESLTLRWDDAPESIVVDFSRRRPMFRIPSETEKGNQDRLLPMTPEFAAHLHAVPESQHRGRVFKLLATDGSPFSTDSQKVGQVVSAIGEAAGVVVDERTKRVPAKGSKAAHKKTVRKFASAHDCRRAFGFRWALRVMPAVLQQLMRHETIETTLKYYVGQDAEATADAIWAAAGNISGNTRSETNVHQTTKSQKTR